VGQGILGPRDAVQVKTWNLSCLIRFPGAWAKARRMTIPYEEPLVPRTPAPRTLPEPPRRGEAGGPPCGVCTGASAAAVWSDEHWSLHPPVGGSLPGSVWVASREHVDSFAGVKIENNLRW